MQQIRDVVLDRVKEEARAILDEAEKEAARELEKAKARKKERFEAEKRRLQAAAHEEAARIDSQAAMDARRKVSGAKSAVIDELVQKIRDALREAPTTSESLSSLINEAVAGTGRSNKVSLSVAEKDLELARKIVKDDENLTAVVVEVTTCDCVGGVIAENEGGTFRVDNTYFTRLDMFLPRILPEIGNVLFRHSEVKRK